MTAKELVLYFGRHYAEKRGEKYPPTWGRDLKIFKELQKSFSDARITDLIDLYFEKAKRIYSIPFFKTELPELMQLEIPIRQQSVEDNESWRFE
jgi:hypothetical protein